MLAQLSQDSPASPSLSPANELARRMGAIYSPKSSAPLLKLDAASSSWKTSQVCLFPTADDPTNQHPLQTFLGSWPKAALIASGCLWPQKIWERRTSGIDGGALRGDALPWLTPKASRGGYTRDGGDAQRERPSLDGQARQWATPQRHDYHALDVSHVERETAGGNRNLCDEILKWATPAVRDVKGANLHPCTSRGRDREDQLANQVAHGPWRTPTAADADSPGAAHLTLLNPDWEELLMGWPVGWTDPDKTCAGIWEGWPMGQGEEQFAYEPPRTCPQFKGRPTRIRMMGNGIVPQCGIVAFVRLLADALCEIPHGVNLI